MFGGMSRFGRDVGCGDIYMQREARKIIAVPSRQDFLAF